MRGSGPGADEERRARLGPVVEDARAVWARGRDGDVLQEFLRGHGCDGGDAVFVTMWVVGCGLEEAQGMYFGAPCRRDDLEFHDAFVEALEREATGPAGIPE
ncbi:hypothetical protein ACWDNT_02025 [Streptomyces sp. NPDC000963]